MAGDLHPFGFGEIAEADLSRLVGKLDHQLRRWTMEGLPALIWLLLLVVWTESAHSVER